MTDVFSGIDDDAEGEVIVQVEPVDAATPSCEECPAELRYEARVRFDERPSRIYVKHVTTSGDPIQVATATPSG